MNQNEMLIPKEFDLQGHRGARGQYPENTINGFIKALDLGVNTLEMDVVITADSQVVLSHEPWFSHEIATDPEGKEITKEDERTHNIYKMEYTQTQTYDVGSRKHQRFPEQINQVERKPRLYDVIKKSELHATSTGRPLPYYNIETKCLPERDDVFHPKPEVFSELLIDVLEEANVKERVYIQSFDVRTLQYIKENYPDYKLVLLVENNLGFEKNIDHLGFIPDVYSPDFELVDNELVSYCKKKGMKLIPWTVNEKTEMINLISMGVDGLITDYPDRFNSLKVD